MKHLVVLGGGTAGTMAANKLRKALPADQWNIVVVDRDDEHHYQPGYLFVPFGSYTRKDVVRSRHTFIGDGITLVQAEIDRVDPAANRVLLEGGRELPYDQLIIASGCTVRPEMTPGLAEGMLAGTVHDFYTLETAEALHRALEGFTGGKLVVHICEMPIKCPPAPMEFAFLADAFFTERGMREQVEITYVTPLGGAFTKPVSSEALQYLLDAKSISIETDFMVERVDPTALVSFDEREVPFDLLVTVPVTMGADFIQRSGLGNELNFVPANKETFQHPTYPNIFTLGDASTIPTSKAGSVAHFAVDVFVENFVEHIAGKPMPHAFDGHANCFIETGHDKALLIDFNYTVEPLPGKFPVPNVGPFDLLKESKINHLGKLSFRWVYWNILLPGHPLPVKSAMSMAGKITS